MILYVECVNQPDPEPELEPGAEEPAPEEPAEPAPVE